MTKFWSKDPDAVLDWYWDLRARTNQDDPEKTNWLKTGETVSTYSITVPTGLTKDSDTLTNSDTVIEAWFSGGTDGETYYVTCHFVTSDGREDDRTIGIKVEER